MNCLPSTDDCGNPVPINPKDKILQAPEKVIKHIRTAPFIPEFLINSFDLRDPSIRPILWLDVKIFIKEF